MSSAAREIITLQIGHYSNFIGSHWWNIQESSFVYSKNDSTDINHDYMFREGKLPGNQETYTPRLLIIDSKGSLGSLPYRGTLYEQSVTGPSTSHALWSGQVDLIHQIPEEKNEFLLELEEDDSKYYGNLDEDKDVCVEDAIDSTLGSDQPSKKQKSFNLSQVVKVWSDFLQPHLHPQTVYLLKEVWHHDEREEGGGWGFQGGASLLKKEEMQDEIFDRIRLLAESCESLQGFHLLCDGHSGMGGMAWSVAQHLVDEYCAKDLFSIVSTPPHCITPTAHDVAVFVTSIVQSYTELSKLSSVLLPLNLRNHIWYPDAEGVNFPYLEYQLHNPYESSSILGSFMDTVTLPYRTRHNPLPMNYFIDLVTPSQRKVVGGSIALPLGIREDSFLADWLIENGDFTYRSVSAGCDITLNPVAEYRVIRGVDKNRLVSADLQLPQGVRYHNAWDLYDNFLKERQMKVLSRQICGIRDPLKTTTPFPDLFCETVSETGLIKRLSHATFMPNTVTSSPVAAAVAQCEGVSLVLRELLHSIESIDVKKVPRLIEEDLDQESWNNVKEDLNTLVEHYNLIRNEDEYCDSD